MKNFGLNFGKKKTNALVSNNKDIADNNDVIFKKHINIYDLQNNVEYLYSKISQSPQEQNVNEFVNKKMLFMPNGIVSIEATHTSNGIKILNNNGYYYKLLAVNKFNDVYIIAGDEAVGTGLNLYPTITITKTIANAQASNVDRYLLLIRQNNKLLVLRLNKNQFIFSNLTINNSNYNLYYKQLITLDANINNIIFPNIDWGNPFAPIVNFNGDYYMNGYKITHYIDNVPFHISTQLS